VHDRKYDDNDAGRVADVGHPAFRGIALGGSGDELVGRPGIEDNEKSKDEPNHTPQQLI
jgi:hypothetical protein